MEAYVSDIETIADHLKLTKFHLFGQSWGGLYAQLYAQTHPERIHTLWLSSPSSGTNDLWGEVEKEVLAYNQAHCTDWEFLKMGIYSLLGGAFGIDWAFRSLFVLVLNAYHRDHKPDLVIDPSAFEPIKADPINKTRPEISRRAHRSYYETDSGPKTKTVSSAITLDIYCLGWQSFPTYS